LITFSGLGRKAAGDREGVMTTAYGTAANCQPVEWNSEEGDLVVEVKCFDNAGNPVNSQFTVLVADGSRADGALGFALADQPAAATYTPTNSAVRPTGNVMVERLEEGRSVVRFTGINRRAGPAATVPVSAVGENPGRCGIENWAESPDDATPTNVWIRCSNPSDAPADIPFTIVGLQ